MKIALPRRQRRMMLKPVAAACAASLSLLAQTSHAQDAAPAPARASSAPVPVDLNVVTVVGIRQSLETTENLKRESRGLVDGIVAEDIGKFPDTNLAESMQRIAGVSIDRSPNGEGSKITVRGFGPDYNMVLLNGRQMPTGVISDENGGANGSRAFDFSNLAADAISAVEVYKTSRADLASGGIGATVNVKTVHPLDVKRRLAAINVKGNYDQSEGRLPSEMQSSKVTPDISGIYSDTFADGKFGIALTASYSKRDSGYNKGYTQGGWRTFTATDTADWGVIPQAPTAAQGADPVTNRPTGLYSTSVDMRYSLTAVERTRANGQLTLQFQPVKALTFTLDETVASNIQKKKNEEYSSWFNFSFGGQGSAGAPLTFTGGPVAAPVVQTAAFPADNHDIALNVGEYGQKTLLTSTGFNADFKASDSLKLNFDYHHSRSRTTPDSPYGTYSVMDLGMFGQGTATAYYDSMLPILQLGSTADPYKFQPGLLKMEGSQFVNNLSDQSVDQGQFGADWKLGLDDTINFGLGFTKTKNRAASYNNQNNDWGGIGNFGDYASLPIYTSSMSSLFTAIPGHNDPRMTSLFYSTNFSALHALAIKEAETYGTPDHLAPLTPAEAAAYFSATPNYSNGNDWRTTEKTTSAYVQWNHYFDGDIPQNLSVGMRYEGTKEDSSSQVVSRIAPVTWSSQNEIGLAQGPVTFGSDSGKYSYFLPNLDYDADVTNNVKVRASYGETIARPTWNYLLGGTSFNNVMNYGGGSGSEGNPDLKPLVSHNFDLSGEWYYSKSSYIALGGFVKRVKNFVETTTTKVAIPGVTTPIGGAYFNAALAHCTSVGTPTPLCERNYIFATYNGQAGVAASGTVYPVDSASETQGTITALAGDPQAYATVTLPSNAGHDTVKGIELTGQHMFGHSGFGVSANYTLVRAGLHYDNTNLNTQIALLGVSNSANLVGFYEDDTWSTRLAYNWRDKFLSSMTDGAGNNPVYTAPYGQVDLSIGYKIGKHLTLQADLLNLTDSFIRQYGRNADEVVAAIQTGRRYLAGARYEF